MAGAVALVMKRTRLGLEVRAVTQNPGMAASVGIDPGRVNMMTFGLGSGIAGIAGGAIPKSYVKSPPRHHFRQFLPCRMQGREGNCLK